MTSNNSPASRRSVLAVPSILTAALLVGSVAVGCIGGQSAGSDDTSTIDSEIQSSTAIARAMEWVNAKLHYCQTEQGRVDGDSSCWAWEGPSHICHRESNAAWNPYRSDCSGLVSWAWGLPAPGRVTGEFSPFQNDITHTISGSNLQPGDALNSSDHVILFKSWVTHGSEANFIEEPGCSSSEPYAHEFTSHVSISGDSVFVSYEGKTFTAIRYNGISGGGGTPPPPSGGVSCTVDGVAGDCISTTSCDAKPGHRQTPGYCPGAANIQCCTAPPSCHVNGTAGLCMERTACNEWGGHHYVSGYCPGGATEECCIP